MKFELGRIFISSGVHAGVEDKEYTMDDIMKLITKHAHGDWGDLSEDDKKINELAIENGDRILSSHNLKGEKVWIITEADRSQTTVLYPDEY